MLPVCISATFRSAPGSSGEAEFQDVTTGATFAVPMGDIQKNHEDFEGEAKFAAAVVDVSTSGGLSTMPPLIGTSAAGAVIPIQSIGAVFTELRDASDGSHLTLRPGSYIRISIP